MAKIMQARPDYRNGYVYDPAGIIRRLYGLLLSGGLWPGRELTCSANMGLIAIIYGDTVKQVEEVLRLCREKDIMVTAFLPPFAPSLYRLMAESGHYDYMTKIYPALLPLFQRYGFELYDFTGSSVIDDAMSYDGYHPDDRGSHRILLSIKAQNSVLAGRIAGE
jgi:hypothetical protein